MNMADRALDRFMFVARALVISQPPGGFRPGAAPKRRFHRANQIEKMVDRSRRGFGRFFRNRATDRGKRIGMCRYGAMSSILRKPALPTLRRQTSDGLFSSHDDLASLTVR